MHFQKMQFLGVFRPFLQRSLPKLTEELSMVSLSFLAAASNKLKYSTTNSFLYSLVAPKSRRPNWKKKYWIIHCIAYHYLCRCCFELEIRVIIKIESHLWYPINIWLIWMGSKKKMRFGIWWIQKMGYFQISMFFYQNFRFGGLALGLIE